MIRFMVLVDNQQSCANTLRKQSTNRFLRRMVFFFRHTVFFDGRCCSFVYSLMIIIFLIVRCRKQSTNRFLRRMVSFFFHKPFSLTDVDFFCLFFDDYYFSDCPPSAVRRPPSAVRRPPSAVRRSPFAVACPLSASTFYRVSFFLLYIQ